VKGKLLILTNRAKVRIADGTKSSDKVSIRHDCVFLQMKRPRQAVCDIIMLSRGSAMAKKDPRVHAYIAKAADFAWFTALQRAATDPSS